MRGYSGDRLLITKDGSETGDLSKSSIDHVIALDMTDVIEIEIIRDIIKIQSVKSEIFKGVGYIRITSFTEQTESGLIKSIKKILVKAIKYGGSTIRDYVASDGTLGNFQSHFSVYNKEGKKISKFAIKKVLQYGRSTYYCPGLQKEQNRN